MKIVINKCYGGFGISNKAMKALLALKSTEFTTKKGTFGREFYYTSGDRIHLCEMFDSEIALRTDPDLVEVVTRLGEKAWGNHAELAVIEIPDDVKVTIEEYDGYEHIAEVHRKWY